MKVGRKQGTCKKKEGKKGREKDEKNEKMEMRWRVKERVSEGNKVKKEG